MIPYIKKVFHNNRAKNQGFSLIEVLVVVTIALLVVLVVLNLRSNVDTLQNLVSQKFQSRSDIDQTMQMVTTGIRSASLSVLGAYPIIAAGTSSFTFYSDIDQDGVTEMVRYFLATSSIERGVTQPTGTPAVYATSSEKVTDMIDNIVSGSGTSTPLFSYYNTSYVGSGSPMSYPIDISQIRLVGFSFGANVNVNQSSAAENFSAFIDLRNLRSN